MEVNIFGVVLILLIVIAAWLIWTYNRFIRHKNNVREAWSGIDVQLKRRHNLIPNVIEAVKGYMGHEQGTLDSLTRLRTGTDTGESVSKIAQHESDLSRAIGGILAVAEAIQTSRPTPASSIFNRSCMKLKNRYSWRDVITTVPCATGTCWWNLSPAT